MGANRKETIMFIESAEQLLKSCGYTVIRPDPATLTDDELENFVALETVVNREYKRRWREKNRQHINDYQRKYLKEHPQNEISKERRRKATARWRAKHREQIREYARRWSAEHPDAIVKYRKNWEAKNPDYGKQRWAKYKAEQAKRRQEQEERIKRDIEKHKQELEADAMKGSEQ